MVLIISLRTAYGREIGDHQQPLLLHRPKKSRFPTKRGRRTDGSIEKEVREGVSWFCFFRVCCF